MICGAVLLPLVGLQAGGRPADKIWVDFEILTSLYGWKYVFDSSSSLTIIQCYFMDIIASNVGFCGCKVGFRGAKIVEAVHFLIDPFY